MMYGIGHHIYVPASRTFGTITEFLLIGPDRNVVVAKVTMDDGSIAELYPSQMQPVGAEVRKDWYMVENT